jgi:hypothetical protein
MLHPYRAILHGDHVEWLDKPPEQTQSVPVHITLLEEAPLELACERGQVMAEALAALISQGTFAGITDPVAWQRSLPARER